MRKRMETRCRQKNAVLREFAPKFFFSRQREYTPQELFDFLEGMDELYEDLVNNPGSENLMALANVAYHLNREEIPVEREVIDLTVEVTKRAPDIEVIDLTGDSSSSEDDDSDSDYEPRFVAPPKKRARHRL